MNAIPVETGRVVISKCGRDQGRVFLVIGEIDDDFVLISDGDTRKIARPKKKRRRHLSATRTLMTELRNDMMAGRLPEDCRIRACLKEEG